MRVVDRQIVDGQNCCSW